jgi:hypothetical protein
MEEDKGKIKNNKDLVNLKKQLRAIEMVLKVEYPSQLRAEQNLFVSVFKDNNLRKKVSFFDGKFCLIQNSYEIYCFVQFKSRIQLSQLRDKLGFEIISFYLPERNKFQYYNENL